MAALTGMVIRSLHEHGSALVADGTDVGAPPSAKWIYAAPLISRPAAARASSEMVAPASMRAISSRRA